MKSPLLAAVSHLEERRARRKQLNLRSNVSNSQLDPSKKSFEIDPKTTGRWSRDEHEKFIEGNAYLFFFYYILALSLYKRDWKRVEAHIGTRSGAQIRSHAQKYFTRIEKELPGADIDAYILAKAKSLRERKALQQGSSKQENNNSNDESDFSLDVQKEQPQVHKKSFEIEKQEKTGKKSEENDLEEVK